jgi:hypothetical protein
MEQFGYVGFVLRTACGPRHESGGGPLKLIIALFITLAPLAAHGQMLKCISQDGRVEYASQCPPGTREQQTGIKNTKEGPSSGATPQQPKSYLEREADFRKRQVESAEARQKDEKKAAEDQERQANCAQAQTYLRSLQAGNRIARTDPKTGERVFLDDPDRPAEVAKAQRAVDTNCK